MTLTNDTNRTADEFGYLTVTDCVLTGDDVAPYWGYEIPNFKELKLESNKIYNVYRPKDEIKESNFSNKPLLSKHMDFSADDYKNKFIVGTIGETEMSGDQLRGTVVFWDQKAIDELEKGKKYLSCGYMYEPILEKGFYKNAKYDVKMVNIVANHVAMVDNPRYKPAIVADEDIKNEKGVSMFFKKKTTGQEKLTLDAAFEEIKNILATDASPEEKMEAVEKVKEKMSKDKMSKDKKDCMSAPAKDKKDEELDDNEEDVVEDEEEVSEEEKEKEVKKKKMTGDSARIQRLVADSVAKEMEKFTKKTLAFDAAIKEYERVCGRVNRMAFDSDAEKVLDTILKNHKHNSEGKTFEQKQAMVEMIPALRGTQPTAKIVMDNASTGNKCLPDNLINFLDKRA